MSGDIIHKIEDGIMWIIFNRPSKRNAIKSYSILFDALTEAASDESVVFTVFTGVGDYFSSGNDFSVPRTQQSNTENNFFIFIEMLIDHPKPLIALVNGPAVGMAATMLGLFELVLASDKATFWTPFPTLAICPEGCSTVTFPSIMGYSTACEMLMFGQKFSAERAAAAGLVTRVFPDGIFKRKSTEYVKELSKLPKTSILTTKHLLRDRMREKLHETNQLECAQVQKMLSSPETRALLATKFGHNLKSKI